MSQQHVDVIIAGGGPVGLFLGCRLIQLGLNIRILEKTTQPHQHSKSIGVHPPSLELFDQLGLAEKFLDHGKKISRGYAMSGPDERTGMLDFSVCKPPHQYVLTIPQHKTESILEQKITQFDDDILIRGAEVTDIKQNQESVTVSYNDTESVSANYVIATDGKQSQVRKLLGIIFAGGQYPYTYAMGDYSDNTGFGSDAAIYACPQGLAECFPLPDGRRRWVAQLPDDVQETDKNQFARIISERTGIFPDVTECTMFSNFNAEHFLADRFVSGRVLLAGDSAHIVSPIGGQGMNLGWLDAWAAADVMAEIGHSGVFDSVLLEAYHTNRKRVAIQAIKRAEFNMKLGHRNSWPTTQKALLWLLLHTPARTILANRFTMRGL